MTTEINVTIAIYRGDPVDYQKYRHTALFFNFKDGSKSILIHAVGPPQGMSLQTQEDYDPMHSSKLANQVEVGWLKVAMSKPQLISFVFESQPENSNPEYNCHSWVEAVLRHMRDAGYVSSETYSSSVDRMLDITLEAEDE